MWNVHNGDSLTVLREMSVIDDGALTWNYQDCLDSIWLELIQALNRRCEFIGVEMSVTSDRETRDRDNRRLLGLRVRHVGRDREE